MLDGRLEEYLRIRRSLGYKLERDGKLLAQFIAWLHEQHAAAVTVEHASAWVSLPAAGSGWLRLRMSVVRGFAAYLHTLDPAVPVPPAGLFPPGPHRAVPYLYSADEIAALIAATDTLRYPLQRATYRNADRPAGGDRDAGRRGDRPRPTPTSTPSRACSPCDRASSASSARCRCTPARSRRCAPISAARRAARPRPSTPALLVSTRRHPAELLSTSAPRSSSWSAAPDWHPARRRAGPACTICGTPSRSPPCWTGTATAATSQARLPLLSTYLGHVDPANTYWYLHAAPELLALAAHRLERASQDGRRDERARPDPAGVLHRPADPPAPRQPAHHRRLPRHAAAAARASPPQRTGKPPFRLDLADLDAPLIGAFLDHLEHERGNSVRTRNARLAAIHSLFRFAALRHPEHAADDRPGAGDPAQTLRPAHWSPTSPSPRSTPCSPPPTATPGPADATTPCSLLAVQTGLRVSELTGARPAPTSTSAPAPTSAATARAARTGSPR